MGQLIAKLRAWLIELVREAIRIENQSQNYVKYSNGNIAKRPALIPVVKVSIPITDPTFEQMQAQSIEQQEKYYAKP